MDNGDDIIIKEQNSRHKMTNIVFVIGILFMLINDCDKQLGRGVTFHLLIISQD